MSLPFNKNRFRPIRKNSRYDKGYSIFRRKSLSLEVSSEDNDKSSFWIRDSIRGRTSVSQTSIPSATSRVSSFSDSPVNVSSDDQSPEGERDSEVNVLTFSQESSCEHQERALAAEPSSSIISDRFCGSTDTSDSSRSMQSKLSDKLVTETLVDQNVREARAEGSSSDSSLCPEHTSNNTRDEYETTNTFMQQTKCSNIIGVPEATPAQQLLRQTAESKDSIRQVTAPTPDVISIKSTYTTTSVQLSLSGKTAKETKETANSEESQYGISLQDNSSIAFSTNKVLEEMDKQSCSDIGTLSTIRDWQQTGP